jgi:hypothetical protein
VRLIEYGLDFGNQFQNTLFQFKNSARRMVNFPQAGMAELADALALGASGRKAVQVQVLFSAPPAALACPIFPIALSSNAGVGCTYFCEITMLLCPASLWISKAPTPLSPSRVQECVARAMYYAVVWQFHPIAQRPVFPLHQDQWTHLAHLLDWGKPACIIDGSQPTGFDTLCADFGFLFGAAIYAFAITNNPYEQSVSTRCQRACTGSLRLKRPDLGSGG